MEKKFKTFSATVQAHLPGASTGRAQSPHSSPRVERDQPTYSPNATTIPGTTAPSNAQSTQLQPTVPKRTTRSNTADNSATGPHAQPAQPSQPPQQVQPAQPAQPAQSGHTARPGQAAAQPVQQLISGPDPRKVVTEPVAPSRDREVHIHEREVDPSKREVDPSKREVDPSKREVDPNKRGVDPSKRVADLNKREAELRRLEAYIDKRHAIIQQQDADIKQREAIVTGQEARLQHLESEPYRQELLSIRVHMQVNDLQEPWEISQRFAGITRKVEEISRNLGERLFASQPIRELTTGDFAKVLPRRASGGQSSAVPTQPVIVDPEDFIDFGCRALLNNWLIERIFGQDIFHPALSQQDNDLFLNTYDAIRKREPQVIAGRWRVSTFKAFESHAYPHQERVLEFCQQVLGAFCCHVYKPDACSPAISSIFPAVGELFEQALTWTRMARGSVVMLDFHPDFFYPGAHFNSQDAELEGPKPKPPASKTILLTSKLGLLSSRAIGESKKPEYSFQTMATVLAAEYFM